MRTALMLVVLVLSACAQDSPPRADSEAPPQPRVDYRFGPGDTIAISVFGVPELGRTARITNSGKIHFPSLGVLRVVNMTARELEQDIARRLAEAGLVRDAVVEIHVVQSRGQTVYVLGEVMTPGQFVMTREMRLLDLLVLSQGLNEVASKKGYLYRRKLKPADPKDPGATREATQTEEAVEIDLGALTSGARPDLNLLLRGGDIFYIPVGPRYRYFVIGDVVQTGSFEMKAQSIKASQALAKAGGPLKTAKISRGILVRFVEDGQQVQLPVDFGAVLKGRKPDVDVLPNDIIFIPGSSAKTIAYGLLNIIPSTAGRMVTVP